MTATAPANPFARALVLAILVLLLVGGLAFASGWFALIPERANTFQAVASIVFFFGTAGTTWFLSAALNEQEPTLISHREAPETIGRMLLSLAMGGGCGAALGALGFVAIFFGIFIHAFADNPNGHFRPKACC